MCESNTPYGTGVREGSWLYRFLLTQWMCAYWCICFGENNPKLTWLLQKEHNFYTVLRKLKLYTIIIHTNLSSIHHHQSIFFMLKFIRVTVSLRDLWFTLERYLGQHSNGISIETQWILERHLTRPSVKIRLIFRHAIDCSLNFSRLYRSLSHSGDKTNN